MAIRIIESPGVQITEKDLSFNSSLPVGTGVLVCGYASQGPTDVLIEVTSKQEFEDTFFGINGPTNAAERYFYHSAKEVLNSPARLLVTRMPYGSGGGTGYNADYSALLYPISANSTVYVSATNFSILTPTVTSLTESQYQALEDGQLTWSTGASAINGIGTAGLIIVNTAKTTMNQNFEGVYISITDNQVVSATGYATVKNVFSVDNTNSFTLLSETLISKALSSTADDYSSISHDIEASTSFDFTLSSYNDSVIVSIYKLVQDINNPTGNKLLPVFIENHVGSFDPDATINKNGSDVTFDIEKVINNNSNYAKVFMNRNLKNVDWTLNNTKRCTVRETDDSLRGIGVWETNKDNPNNKVIGAIPQKLERALALAENVDVVPMDIVVEAGLGTMWAFMSGNSGVGFDELAVVDMAPLYQSENSGAVLATYYKTIFNLFETFVRDTRKDSIYIADPLRSVFITGRDTKVLSRPANTFTQQIYYPLRNLYGTVNSNYTATYASWVKNYDSVGNDYYWLPFSAWQAAIIARMDATLFPWYAPAGFESGVVRNVTDIALNPSQKQRDMLYRIGVNPVVNFPQDGTAVWGQKTLQGKPSAFDRINVRRLFLTLEKATGRIARYFVMQPNTVFTRARFVNTVKPIFDLAKNNEGLYDYQIVCDERNNTPDVIDNNEMRVSIYIKPVRTAEFILIEFVATRTGQDFAELTG